MRLHFAELYDAAPGTRVFDVFLQNNCVTQALDIARLSGAPRRPLALEFRGIMAATNLTLELVSKATNFDWTTAPMLNGFEISVEK